MLQVLPRLYSKCSKIFPLSTQGSYSQIRVKIQKYRQFDSTCCQIKLSFYSSQAEYGQTGNTDFVCS
ncbi:hypothetical protein FGO68_gene355 [Halteria grandinella]|uniref:Uncharacterized protein n=1 Tax=Halteria grandinella TaxID=5974 RepID=A0A8J8NXX1_HALGN|nr:hypothetical protein FGO68_gene355 [Halteria grandinella]